jgi:RNA polymerase sigma-70 factor (ECF subfamily)
MKEIDERIVRQAAKKDEHAFKKVYDYYAPFVWRVVYKTVNGDRNDAVEIVQESFIRVYKSLHAFSFNSGLSTWIYRIAFNSAKSFILKRQKRLLDTEFDDEKYWNNAGDPGHETRDMVNFLLNKLSPSDRFILTGREIEGLTFEELSEITGKSSEALRTKVSRIKGLLRSEASAVDYSGELSGRSPGK